MNGTTLARERLTSLSLHAADVDAVERRILAQGEQQYDELGRRIDSLRPMVLTDEAAAAEYQELVARRGSVAQVIAQARENLKAAR